MKKSDLHDLSLVILLMIEFSIFINLAFLIAKFNSPMSITNELLLTIFVFLVLATTQISFLLIEMKGILREKK